MQIDDDVRKIAEYHKEEIALLKEIRDALCVNAPTVSDELKAMHDIVLQSTIRDPPVKIPGRKKRGK